MNTTTKETEFFTELTAATDATGHMGTTGASVTLPAGTEVCIAQTFDGKPYPDYLLHTTR